MKNKGLFFVLVLCLFLLISCAPIVEMRADQAMWVTTEEMMEYKSVKTGSVKVGDINVPIYGYRWKKVDSAEKTGVMGSEIKFPQKLDCSKTLPENPSKGDIYCELLLVDYYLLFGDGKWKVEVTEEVWLNHTRDTIYKTQEDIFGLQIVQ